MKKSAALVGAMVLLALTGSVRAQPKDPAELLPAGTLAYLELRDPAQVSRELAALIKGSDLENMPATMARFREKLPPGVAPWMLQDVGAFGIIFSPEMLAEAARLQGGAVAITGITKDNEPEVVGIALAGDSHGPTFFLRAYLTLEDVRSVAEVEGVTLYRARRRDFMAVKPVPGQPPPPPAIRDHGPTYALLPGMVVVGSTTDSVRDVVSRVKGKGKGATLAMRPEFQQAAKLRERPGLFGYANLASLSTKLEGVMKGEEGVRPDIRVAGWATLLTQSSRSLRTAVASLTLRNGDVDLLAQVMLDPKETSSVLELLPDQKVNLEVLHAVPKDSLFAATLALPEGEKRWQKLVDLADAFAKKAGVDALPSKQIEAVEGSLGFKFGKDVFGKITGLTLAVSQPGAGARDSAPMPLIIVEASDVEAARSLEDVLPKLVGVASGGEAPSPTTERIDGQRVRSLPGAGLPGGSALHYGQHGKLLVLGQDRKVVARALVDSTKKSGLLAEAGVAAAVKEVDEPIAVAVWPLGKTLVYWLSNRAMSASFPGAGPPPAPIRKGARTPKARPALARADLAPLSAATGAEPPADLVLVQRPEDGPAPAGQAADEKLTREFARAVEPLPALVISLTRKPDRLELRLRQTGLQAVSVKTINALIEGSMQIQMQQRGGRFGAGAKFEAATPAAPPPPPRRR